MVKLYIEATEEELKVLSNALDYEAARFFAKYQKAKIAWEDGSYSKEFMEKCENDLVLFRSIQDKIKQAELDSE